jgi:hypothetical protein
MQFNDKATFTRSSNFILENWINGSIYDLLNPSSAAFLSVEVSINEPGVLVIDGFTSAGNTITEYLSFTESGIKLSENEFRSITTLTPSWLTYNISIRAEDKQGQPILSATTFGPYLISIMDISSERQRDNVAASGWERGQWLVGYIQAFQPQIKDHVVTSKGWHGWAQDVVPSPHINYPKGWQFFIIAETSQQ